MQSKYANSSPHLVGVVHQRRHTPVARAFNAQVVVGTAQNNLEPAVLAPVGAPRVTTDPVLGAVSAHTPTNNGDDVVVFNVVEVFGVDSASVLFESVGGIHQAGNRSSIIITSLVQSSCIIRIYFETTKKMTKKAAFNDIQTFSKRRVFF
jgi:hypothetical protein